MYKYTCTRLLSHNLCCRVLAGLHKATKRRYSCIVSVYYDYTIVPCSVWDCLVDCLRFTLVESAKVCYARLGLHVTCIHAFTINWHFKLKLCTLSLDIILSPC